MKEYLDTPLTAKLVGGPLDGDEFDLLPNGSILPPMRLSYAYIAPINGQEQACWLNYEHQGVAEWGQGTATYNYSGISQMN